jgi:hypothetical protein
MKRKFNKWLAAFRKSIAGYDYYLEDGIARKLFV